MYWGDGRRNEIGEVKLQNTLKANSASWHLSLGKEKFISSLNPIQARLLLPFGRSKGGL